MNFNHSNDQKVPDQSCNTLLQKESQKWTEFKSSVSNLPAHLEYKFSTHDNSNVTLLENKQIWLTLVTVF